MPYKLRSEALVLNGQTNSAIDSLTEIFNIFPNEFDSMERLANIYFENDMKEDAFKILDLIKSKDINNSYAKKMLGLNKWNQFVQTSKKEYLYVWLLEMRKDQSENQ